MGSERLSHMFTMQDPTYKKNSKHEDEQSSSHHSLSHTSGTQPVSMSNGPKSSPSSSMIKHKLKINPKYKKLIKLYSRQLAHITTTLNAITSLSKSDNTQILESSKKRADTLRDNLESFRNSPSKQDHIHFDPLKKEIDQLIDDLKSYKVNNSNPDSRNTIDYLIGFPLNASDSENDDGEEEKTLVYF